MSAAKNKPLQSLIVLIFFMLLMDISIILDIYILRQVLVFICLAILPGLIMYNLFNIHSNFTEKILLSTGLSIFFIMFFVCILNIFLPLVGISRPITFEPLLYCFNIAILILGIIALKQKKIIFNINRYNLKLKKTTLFFLCAILIPLMAILGSLAIRYYMDSSFSTLFILVAACIVAYLIFNSSNVPEGIFPILIYSIAISLLLNRTLTSPYLFGSDIHYEYYLHKIILQAGYWDVSYYYSNLNAMLSVTILPAIFSILMNIDAIWVFKIVYPILFALVPVCLYQIYKKRLNFCEAFLATFLMMSFYTFYSVMLWLPRQQIAELFVVLVILLFMSKDLSSITRVALCIIFTASIVVSHYGVTYIFLLYLVIIWVVSSIVRFKKPINITFGLSMIFFVIALSWYINVSGSIAFNTIVITAKNTIASAFNEIFDLSVNDPEIMTALGGNIFRSPFWHSLGQCWQLAIQAFILVGFVSEIIRLFKGKNELKNIEFYLFSIASMVVILIAVLVPGFAGALKMNRIYSITLLFLSPFCILGINKIIDYIPKTINQYKKQWVFLCVFIPYFLFNTGVIFELSEKPYNLKLLKLDCPGSIYQSEDISEKSTYLSPEQVSEQNVIACKWLKDKVINKMIYSDIYRKCELSGYGLIPPIEVASLNLDLPKNKYLYLGSENIKDDSIKIYKIRSIKSYKLSDMKYKLEERNGIYSNGGAMIYK